MATGKMTTLNQSVVGETVSNPYEKIPVQVFNQASEASKEIARRIADMINERAAQGKNCVLGLATGSTPVGIYNELVRMHQEDGLSFYE